MDPVTLTRTELYELVWSTPMRKLAAEYGLSDVGLAKTCDRWGIPRPGRGYWAQIAAGQKPRRAKLPKVTDGAEQTIVLHRVPAEMQAEQAPPSVVVADRLTRAHPAVTWLEGALKSAESDKYGRLIVGRGWRPNVCIRQTSARRALLLLDALFKGLTERGHVVEAKPRNKDGEPELTVTVATRGEVRIEVDEKLATRPHVLTVAERERKERWNLRVPKYDYFPDGELSFKIEGAHYKYVGRKSCSDTKLRRVDDLLGQMIMSIEGMAEFNHREDVAAKEQQRLWEESERRRLRGDRLNMWRSWLATDLEGMATAWQIARRASEFLDAFEKKISGTPRTEVVNEWLAAARRFTGHTDPLSAPDQVAKELDPSNDVLAAFVEQREAATKRQRT